MEVGHLEEVDMEKVDLVVEAMEEGDIVGIAVVVEVMEVVEEKAMEDKLICLDSVIFN